MRSFHSSGSVIGLLALGVLLGCSAGTGDASAGAGSQGGSGGTAPIGGSRAAGG